MIKLANVITSDAHVGPLSQLKQADLQQVVHLERLLEYISAVARARV